jgi:RNA polymerase sigma-70 factor (ECF subfamily)
MQSPHWGAFAMHAVEYIGFFLFRKTHHSGSIMTEQERDWLLVEKSQSGDKRAFNLLVIKYRSRLFRLISRVVRSPSEAEDIVQETFIKAYSALPNFRGDAAFYTWLYRIGINNAKNLLLHQSRSLEMNGFEYDAHAESGQTFLADFNTPETLMAARQVTFMINEAMDKLPELLRIALALRELDGFSYEDISEIMACPIGTVRSRIFRAREFIAQRLDGFLEEPGRLHC